MVKMISKNLEKKYLLPIVILMLVSMMLAMVVFSSARENAFAETTEKTEVFGTIYHKSGLVDKPPYSGESQALGKGFNANFNKTESESISLKEGVDFKFTEDTKWYFRAPGADESEQIELNTEVNNFVFAGVYRREVTIIGDACVQKEGADITTVEYEIKPLAPRDLIKNADNTPKEFKAVVGMKGSDVEFPMGWKVAVEEDRLTDEKFTEAKTIENVKLAFEVPTGDTEANYLTEGEDAKKGAVKVIVETKPTIIFKGEGTQQATLTDNITYNEETNKYTGTVLKRPSNFAKAGYNFSHFTLEGDTETKYSNEVNAPEEGKTFSVDPKAIITFTSNWTPRNDTEYKVKHYRQAINEENGYIPPGIGLVESFKGETDSTVEINITEGTADGKIITIKGFTFDPVKTAEVNKYKGVVSADSKNPLALELYYKRDTYTLAYAKGDDIEGSLPDGSTHKFDVSVTLDSGSSLSKPGYQLVGWKDGLTRVDDKDKIFAPGSSYTIIQPQDENGNKLDTITMTAVFEARKDTPYTVMHCTADGTIIKEEKLQGETDLEIKAVSTVPGYKVIEHEGTIKTGTITADGELVLKLYYEKIDYNITFTVGTSTIETRTYNIDNKFTLPAGPEKEGFTFKGWVINGQTYEAGKEITVKGPMKIEASYSNNSVEVIVGGEDANVILAPEQKTDLSAGAIAGIVIACVVVLAASIFSIVWFGVLKRSFKDMRIKRR